MNIRWRKHRAAGRIIREMETVRRKYRVEQSLPVGTGYVLYVHNHRGYGQSLGWRRALIALTLREIEAKVMRMEA